MFCVYIKYRGVMSPKLSSPDRETVIVSFRAPVELAKRLDEMAQGDQRNRANFILKMLTAVTSAHEPLVLDGVSWLQAFHGFYAKDHKSRETEFWRGNISGFRYAVGEIMGETLFTEFWRMPVRTLPSRFRL